MLAKNRVSVHYMQNNEWMLAKGRRNCVVNLDMRPVREVRGETGYQGYLLPVALQTRAVPKDETNHVLCELTVRGTT